ncbi:MAG: transporter substrate-binding domain-containing protein [Candidatus Thiodiazotropha sp.]
MKKEINGLFRYWAILLISCIAISDVIAATQPRITPGLLSPERLELFVYEYPPLASLEIPSGGLYPEIVQAALSKENIKATITILPVKSLVKYNLLQDNAIAIIGSGWNFSDAERKQLIVIPFCIVSGGYYYYRPAQDKVLSLDNNLTDLKGTTFAAQKGDEVTKYREAGINVSFANVLSSFHRLKGGKVDFLSAPQISNDWIVGNYYPAEKNNFVLMENSDWETITPIIFNKNNSESDGIASKFREGLIKIQADGTYKDILEKYYGERDIPKDYFQRLTHEQKEAEALN